jgi:hypothetical protein
LDQGVLHCHGRQNLKRCIVDIHSDIQGTSVILPSLRGEIFPFSRM